MTAFLTNLENEAEPLQAQPKAGDVFQTDTTVDPDSDPVQTMRRAYQNSPGAGQ
jgi:hypothetical protein